jgi:hypothetical protein
MLYMSHHLSQIVEHLVCASAFLGTCTPNPVIASSDPPYDGLTGPELTLLFEQCEVHQVNHYLGKNYQANVKFVVDLGCDKAIKSFILRNTQNGIYSERCILTLRIILI